MVLCVDSRFLHKSKSISNLQTTLVGDHISISDDEVKKHKCDICDKEFDKYELDIHFATSHNNKETKNEYMCDKAFNQPEKHKTDNGSVYEGPENHKCELCDKAFSQLWHLKIHINRVHEGLKNHKCDLCDKAFGQSSNLKPHVNSVHEGNKNHKCDLCDKSFSQKSDLKKHIRRIHEKPEGTVSKLWAQKQSNIVIKFVNRQYSSM